MRRFFPPGWRSGQCHPAAAVRLCVALATASAVLGCDSHEEEAASAAAPTVVVQRPERREVTDWDEFTGRFVGTERVEIRARVSGHLDAIAFADGQLVRRGDLLFRIDRRPFAAAAAAAEARLSGTRSQLTLAEREFERTTDLLKYRAASEANLEQRQQGLEGARAQVAQSEAALARAKLDLEFTEVRAPLAGRIGRHLVSPGNIVSGGDAGAATLLATVVTMDPIDFSFDIDQAAALRYTRLAETGGRPSSRNVANPVQLALADEAGFPHHGSVVFVDNEADAGTGTIRLRARFENPRDLFAPGVFARVRLIASPRYEALLVPDAAIANDQSRRILYIVGSGDTVEARQVQPGPLHEGMRVIRDGLRGDEDVVVSGLMRVRAGQAVVPTRQSPGSAGGGASATRP
jgi:multidrug efflux system membrane fusion protein